MAVKIFVSYSSHDRKLAVRVFDELVLGGAHTFQYGKSEVIGKTSWEQILEWISQSDVFIVLISRHSLASDPVKEEIDQAHYSYIKRKRPHKIVSAVIEQGADPPLLIERFAHVDLVDYRAGMARLMDQLGLQRSQRQPPPTAPATLSLPDVSDMFAEFKRRNPAPTVATQFAIEAEHIVAKSKKQQPGRIDDLLARSLSDWTPLGFALAAPTLTDDGLTLKWSKVLGALNYVLEGAATADFSNAQELYRGPETSHFQTSLGPKAYSSFRVKAVGFVKLDSPWSNVVTRSRVGSSIWDLYARSKMPAPELTIGRGLVPHARWTEVAGASQYVLERDRTKLFLKPETIYEGAQTNHLDMQATLAMKGPVYYRVKAAGGFIRIESDWSNVVSWPA